MGTKNTSELAYTCQFLSDLGKTCSNFCESKLNLKMLTSITFKILIYANVLYIRPVTSMKLTSVTNIVYRIISSDTLALMPLMRC